MSSGQGPFPQPACHRLASGAWVVSYRSGIGALLVVGEEQRGGQVALSSWPVCGVDAEPPSRMRPAGAAPPVELLWDGVLLNADELAVELGRPESRAPAPFELALAGYRRWGLALLPRLRGSFALVLWDPSADRLICATDRIATVPLYYADAGRGWLVTPSVELLTRQPGVSRELDPVFLAESLAARYHDSAETCYRRIRAVRPCSALRLGPDGVEERLYRELAPEAAAERQDEASIGEHFDAVLEASVGRCLEHGPSGILLSGGLDSVTVAEVAATVCRRRSLPTPWALSLWVPDPSCAEEKELQRLVARSLTLPQELLPALEEGGSLLEAAVALSRDWPLPLTSLWRPALDRLLRQGRERGVATVLTGAGGDEWLGLHYGVAADLARDREWRSLRLLVSNMGAGVLWRHGVVPLARDALIAILDSVWVGAGKALRRRRARARIPAWIAQSPDLRQRLAERAAARTLRRGEAGFHRRDLTATLGRPLTVQFRREGFEHGHRVGVRLLHPFWDGDLIDYAYWLSPPQLIAHGGAKALLRERLERRLPGLGLAAQRKFSYASFVDGELRRAGPGVWRRLGGPVALAELGVVDPLAYRGWVERTLAGGDSDALQRLWTGLSVESWLQGHG